MLFPIQIYAITYIYICSNFWGTQYICRLFVSPTYLKKKKKKGGEQGLNGQCQHNFFSQILTHHGMYWVINFIILKIFHDELINWLVWLYKNIDGGPDTGAVLQEGSHHSSPPGTKWQIFNRLFEIQAFFLRFIITPGKMYICNYYNLCFVTL